MLVLEMADEVPCLLYQSQFTSSVSAPAGMMFWRKSGIFARLPRLRDVPGNSSASPITFLGLAQFKNRDGRRGRPECGNRTVDAAGRSGPLGVVARCRLSCLHQQKTQKRIALLADSSQLLAPAAGVLRS
jgi:hypothetical protein